MKQLVSIILFFAGILNATAQTSGIVRYTETMKMGDIQINGIEDESLKAMIPKEQKGNKILYFNSSASLYENVKEKAEETNSDYEEGNTRMRIRMDRPDEKFYYEFASKEMTQQRTFMGRKFLVLGIKDGSRWKLTGNQKEILGYPCQEATMKEKDQNITAWFTPALPVSTGPSIFAGLPGLVLKADIDGSQIIEAANIDLKAAVDDKIRKPKDGKKMTTEQFRTMVDEKRKEMGDNGNGTIIMRVKR
jgi:GLPGLI family protein